MPSVDTLILISLVGEAITSAFGLFWMWLSWPYVKEILWPMRKQYSERRKREKTLTPTMGDVNAEIFEQLKH